MLAPGLGYSCWRAVISLPLYLEIIGPWGVSWESLIHWCFCGVLCTHDTIHSFPYNICNVLVSMGIDRFKNVQKILCSIEMLCGTGVLLLTSPHQHLVLVWRAVWLLYVSGDLIVFGTIEWACTNQNKLWPLTSRSRYWLYLPFTKNVACVLSFCQEWSKLEFLKFNSLERYISSSIVLGDRNFVIWNRREYYPNWSNWQLLWRWLEAQKARQALLYRHKYQICRHKDRNPITTDIVCPTGHTRTISWRANLSWIFHHVQHLNGGKWHRFCGDQFLGSARPSPRKTWQV